MTNKLTVESVVEKIIWNEIVTGSSGTKDNTESAKELLKVFLEQIRNEILDCVYDSLGNDNQGQVNKVFKKYLNEK